MRQGRFGRTQRQPRQQPDPEAVVPEFEGSQGTRRRRDEAHQGLHALYS